MGSRSRAAAAAAVQGAGMGRQPASGGRGASSAPATPALAALPAAAASPEGPSRRRSTRVSAAMAAAAPSPVLQQQQEQQDAGTAEEPATSPAPRPAKRRRRGQSAAAAAAEGGEEPTVPLAAAHPEAAPAAAEDVVPAAGAPLEEEEAQEEEAPAKPKRGGRRRQPDPPPLQELPTPELLARLRAQRYRQPPLPAPNLGYACLNTAMRELKPPIFTSRDCIQRTKDAKGLPHLGELFLANAKDLSLLIQWNHEHGIRLFRMSSVICPWMGTFAFEDLPQFEEIRAALRFAGDLARTYGQRLTFHPSHFVKLAAPDEQLAAKSLRELEAHSQVMDLLGYEHASPENKINIHIGGVYASQGWSKQDTMRRWAERYAKLSPRCRARVTVENDDVASSFSLEDLLFLHRLCSVPLVFDFHHHRFCPGSLTEREALEAAMKTWPPGVRPVVHWSESQAGRKPHAHSDYVRGPIALHGHEGEVDVMMEAKQKEQALLAVRGDIPFPEEEGRVEEPPPSAAAQVALRLLCGGPFGLRGCCPA